MNEAPLLDTHVWLWWLLGDARLSKSLSNTLDRFAANQEAPYLSDFSFWETQMLVNKKRVQLQMSFETWLPQAATSVRTLRITPPVILEVDRLPESFQGDPADRIILATAKAYQIPLFTFDQRIRRSEIVPIVSIE